MFKLDGMSLDITDHFGWAVAVTASADHEMVDRRRIELIEPGVSAAPIHYESRLLEVAATAALVAKARASVARPHLRLESRLPALRRGTLAGSAAETDLKHPTPRRP
jgi:hypothetical protein